MLENLFQSKCGASSLPLQADGSYQSGFQFNGAVLVLDLNHCDRLPGGNLVVGFAFPTPLMDVIHHAPNVVFDVRPLDAFSIKGIFSSQSHAASY